MSMANGVPPRRCNGQDSDDDDEGDVVDDRPTSTDCSAALLHFAPKGETEIMNSFRAKGINAKQLHYILPPAAAATAAPVSQETTETKIDDQRKTNDARLGVGNKTLT